MNQHILYNFSIVKNDKVYQMIVQPPCTYEEVQEILCDFKVQFEELLKQQKEREEKGKEATPEVQAEVVA